MITVVITTYKRDPQMLERALLSAINQTYLDKEIIVVDDSPSNYEKRKQIEELVNHYNEQSVIYIPHEVNKGACAARNTGLKNARGEYIAFLDDDDEWVEEKLEKQLAEFEKCSQDTALVYCGKIFVNDITGEEKIAKTIFKKGYVFDELIKKNFIGSTSYPLVRTAFLREIGGFDVDMPSSQDIDVWLRLAWKYEVSYVEAALVRYHTHDGECITQDPQKKINAINRINVKHKVYLDEHKDARWRRQMLLVSRYSANGNYLSSLKTWFCTMLLQPTELKENFKYLYEAAACAKFRGKY